MQQQKRTWLSPLEIVAVVLCFIYSGLLSLYLYSWVYLPLATRIFYGILIALPALSSVLLLCGMRQLARIFQWIITLGWGLISLVLLGLMTKNWREGSLNDAFLGLALGLIAAGFAFLHSFIARHLRNREEE